MAATDATGTFETDGSVGTKGKPVPAPVPVTQPDTTDVGRVAAGGWTPASLAQAGTRDTVSGTVVDVYPAYKPAPGPVPGVIRDTTLTDSPVGNGTGGRIPNPALSVTGTLETGVVGAAPAGSSMVPAAPAAPAVVSGDRYVLVSWAQVADPAGDAPVLQYVVESDSGGHAVAGRDARSLRFEQVTGGFAQKFRLRAGNRNGTGPYGPWSTASVSPGNEDEVRPTSLAADNTLNPIYQQDGRIVPGSYGAPSAPGKPTVAAQGTEGTARVSWTASAPAPVSYEVRMSSGQTKTVAGSVLTADVPGLTKDANVTATVKAVGTLQSAVSQSSEVYKVQ